MRRGLFGCALASVMCLRVFAQAGAIAWDVDLDEALKAAKSDKRPVMLAFIMDGEPACDDIVKTHFHDKAIVTAAKEFHCVVCSVGVHAATSAEGTCPRFGCNTCASHQKNSMRAQDLYIQSTRVSAPQFIFLASDGERVLVRHVFQLAPSELLRKMQLALAFSQPGRESDAEKHQADEVKEAMDQAATSKLPYNRKQALDKLAMMDDPRIIDFLIKVTLNENLENVRRIEAIDAMGRRGNAKAFPVLVKLLRSRMPGIRNRSVLALERLAMLEAGDPIRASLKSEALDQVRANLVRALAVCDGASPESAKVILGMIETGTPKDRVGAIRASFDIPASDELKKALLVCAKHTTPIVRGAAFCALAERQVKEAAPIIEKAAASETIPDMKAMAQGALAVLNGTDREGPTALEILRKYLPDERLRDP
jgi:hypothetical protein